MPDSVRFWQPYRLSTFNHWVANHAQRKRAIALPSPVLTLAIQATYPERVLITVTGLEVGQIVTVSRRVTGSTTRTTVRGMSAVTMTTTTLVKADAEAPFGVELTYILTVDSVDVTTKTTTLTLAGSKVVLSDAVSGAAAEVVIFSWPSKQRERPSTVFAIGGRNVVVSGQRGGFTGAIEVFVETNDSRNNLLDLIDGATSGILQIRQAGPYDGVDAYIYIQSDTETRYSQDGTDERRTVALDVVETSAWGSTYESNTFTVQDIADTYPSPLTVADIAADYATVLDIAVGDFS